MNSGSLNLLEPSGPVQACNGIPLIVSFGNCANSPKNLWFRLTMCLLWNCKL